MPSKTKVKETTKNPVLKSIITVAIVALVTACGLGFYFNQRLISDFISAKFFSASPEITKVEESIELTDKAKIIFYASHPVLESQDDFNSDCDSHDDEISVLGCYNYGRIYLYDIKDSELAGIVESTAAHELLHAAWERMSANEKAEISDYIKDVYNDKKYHDVLAEDLETYAESEIVEELHSRIGTEIADLPVNLEKHYAKYFKNQDLVVDFYDSYITPFRELSEEVKDLSEKLEEMNAKIDQQTAAYYQAADALSAEIDKFNNCANTPNCFATETAFYTRRNALLAEQSALDSSYDELSGLVEEYNSLVEEYNANILRGEALEEAINSNKKTESIE